MAFLAWKRITPVRKIGRWLVRILGVVLLTLGLGEAVIRVTGPRYVLRYAPSEVEQYGKPGGHFVWRGQPGNRREFEVPVRLNSLGFHDMEHEAGPQPDRFRIAVVGDSFVEALQVSREEHFARILEKRFSSDSSKPVEVLCFGVRGFGQVKELSLHQRALREFHPDLVINFFFGFNDVLDHGPNLSIHGDQLQDRWAVAFSPSRYRYLPLQYSQVLMACMVYARDRRNSLLQRRGVLAVYWKNGTDEAWEGGWRATFDAVLEMQKLCQRQRAGFSVVHVPSLLEVAGMREGRRHEPIPAGGVRPPGRDVEWDLRYPSARMGEFCSSQGITYLDLSPDFVGHPGSLYFPDDGHWNAEGHRVAAHALYEFLRERIPVPAGAPDPRTQDP